jgi:hypothetical protein
MKLNYLLGFLIVFYCENISSQNEDSISIKNSVKFSFNIGSSHHGSFDSFYTQDKDFANRSFVVNAPIKYSYLIYSGINVNYKIFSKGKIQIFNSIGLDNFNTRHDVTFINIYHQTGDTIIETKKLRNINFSLNSELYSSASLWENKLNLLFGIYGNQVMYSVEKFGLGTTSIGVLAGFEKNIFKKQKIGIYLHQRFWYSGLNREINRLSIRFTL